MVVMVIVMAVIVMVVEMTIKKGGWWNACSMRNLLHSVIQYYIQLHPHHILITPLQRPKYLVGSQNPSEATITQWKQC